MSQNAIAFSFVLPIQPEMRRIVAFFLHSLYCLLFCFSIRDPARQTKFYAKEKKKDGSEYEPESVRVMEASIDRYLRQMNYPDSIISGRSFKTSQETLNSRAKLLWYQGKGKRPNGAQPYNRMDKDIFWIKGQLGHHNGVFLTNAIFKNLSEHMEFKGHQDHYNGSCTIGTAMQITQINTVVTTTV